MESKFNFLKTTFADFYGPGYTNIKEYADPKYKVGIVPTDQNVFVHDCVFEDCTSSSNGALSCGNSIYKLLVYQTSFVSCWSRSSYGGAIYFDSTTNGECILCKICGFDCSSTNSGNSYGQFARINTKIYATYKNYVNDSSFSHSSNMNTDSYYVLCLNYGNILCPSVNLTNNLCYSFTAFYCYPTTGTGSPVSDTFYISYSSIVNNTANGYSCFYHHNSDSSQCIDTCNVINNKQTTSTYGTFYLYANLLIKDSCIIGNNKKNIVFYVSSGKMTISNCTIDDNIFTNGRYYGTVTVIKTITNTFINALSHIATQHCDSFFDSYGTLIGKTNVPHKNLRYLMSCNNKFPFIDSLENVQFVFLYTFLTFDPTNNYFV
jgi:hypothetical protein